jgi:hypothetical protein
MGAVYRARQPALDRLVAVKVLPPQIARDPAFTERFCREARSLARFNHPNIVTVYDFGEAGGYCYIVMEFVAGKNLRQLLHAGAVSEKQMLGIVAQVCDALQYAHDAGVIHRDIKPENILLDTRGRVKIADFGLAKLADLAPANVSLTGSHEVMGTVYYMAPEQLLRNVEVDHRADLYSLGVVFYEMLTGELPVGRFAPPGQRVRVDSRFDAIVLRALESKPENRYQDAAELKRDVEAILAGPALPVANRASWPCVRFTIPDIDWTGGHVRGEVYRNETTLMLDFGVVNCMGAVTHREVRIPLADLVMISLHKETRSKPELVIKVADPAVLARLPAGQHGRGRLRIHPGDFDATRQLVDSILGNPSFGDAPRPPEPAASTKGVHRDVVLVALGLLLTAATGVASTLVVLSLIRTRALAAGYADVLAFAVPIATVLAVASVGLLIAGAVQMLRLRDYRLCLTAAVAAALPWSPAWPLGLAMGIAAVLVLGRRDVMLAFLGQSDAAAPQPVRDADSPGRAVARLRSFWRSIAGYFVTISDGRSGARGEASGKSADSQPR